MFCTDQSQQKKWLICEIHNIVTMQCSVGKPQSYMAIALSDGSGAPTEYCNLTHCKTCSWIAQRTWQIAQGINLAFKFLNFISPNLKCSDIYGTSAGISSIHVGPSSQMTKNKETCTNALVLDTKGHTQRSCVHDSMAQSQVWSTQTSMDQNCVSP